MRGNFLGTDATGLLARPDNSGLEIGSNNDVIGGTAAADRNLVSGNTAGTFSGAILLDGLANNCTVQGNLIGTDATGLHALPNLGGLAVYGVGNVIGGAAAGAANVVSGNALYGMWIEGSVVVKGNLVGIAADGVSPLPNAADGIRIHSSNDSTIGGTLAGEGNLVYSTDVAPIIVEEGVHNTVRGNSIHDNGALGLNLYTGGSLPEASDAGDVDSRSNNLQNFPIVSSVTDMGGSTRIQGILHSSPSTTFDLDFYANPACSNFPREFLEAETYIGSSQITTNGSGKFEYDVTLPVTLEAGARITATATDPAGNTSEFSQRIIFSISPTSGPGEGGTAISISGTDFADPTTLTFGGSAAVTFVNDQSLTTTSRAGSGNGQRHRRRTAEGRPALVKAGFRLPGRAGGQQFYSFVTTLVSNAITVGVGGRTASTSPRCASRWPSSS